MGALSRMMAGQVLRASDGYGDSNSAPTHDFWYRRVGQTSSGVMVTAEEALKASAVLACVRLIAGTIATLPLITYREIDRGKERAKDHWLYALLHDRPNTWQTPAEYLFRVVAYALLWNDSISIKQIDRSGAVTGLVPVHPSRVQKKEMLDTGRVRYRIQGKNGVPQTLVQDELFRLSGFVLTDELPPTTVDIARDVIGLALAGEGFAGAYFRNGANLGTWIEHPKNLGPEAQANLEASFLKNHGGIANAGGVAVLEEGMKLHRLEFNAEEAQLIEGRKFQLAEVARVFGVQPHLIFDLDRSTNNNIEHQGIEFVRLTLRPWLVRLQQAAKRDLIFEDDLFVEFLLDALLAGDTAVRYEAHTKATQAGWKTRNEVRKTENMNTLDGLDEPLVPENMRGLNDPPDPAPGQSASAPAPGRPPPRKRAEALAHAAADRLARKELAALSTEAKRHPAGGEPWDAAVTAFYGRFAAELATGLAAPLSAAQSYCAARVAQVLVHGLADADTLMEMGREDLTRLALGDIEESEAA